jgi:hypothetical protein
MGNEVLADVRQSYKLIRQYVTDDMRARNNFKSYTTHLITVELTINGDRYSAPIKEYTIGMFKLKDITAIMVDGVISNYEYFA